MPPPVIPSFSPSLSISVSDVCLSPPSPSLSSYLSTCLPLSLSVYLMYVSHPLPLSICVSVYLSPSLSICVSDVCLSLRICLPVSPLPSLPLYLRICLPVSLSPSFCLIVCLLLPTPSLTMCTSLSLSSCLNIIIFLNSFDVLKTDHLETCERSLIVSEFSFFFFSTILLAMLGWSIGLTSLILCFCTHQFLQWALDFCGV